MKIRESGMPGQADWDAFFDPDAVLHEMGLTAGCGDVVEFGCGYGTFTIPAAQRVSGTVHALDIDEDMLAATRAAQSGVTNVAYARTAHEHAPAPGAMLPMGPRRRLVPVSQTIALPPHHYELILARERGGEPQD